MNVMTLSAHFTNLQVTLSHLEGLNSSYCHQGPSALLRKLQPADKSLINEAGHPCRPQLTLYRQVDLLSSYIVPIVIPTSSTPLISISLDQCVLSKAVIVSVSDKHYAIAQPNNVEYH
jgi:hypothetical protein